MEYTRVQIVLAGGSWKRGMRVAGAVAGQARAVVIELTEGRVIATIVGPRRARSLGTSAAPSVPGEAAHGKAIVMAGQPVRAKRQEVGRLSRVWCRADTGRVTHLLVREHAGWFGHGQERIVPAEYVEQFGPRDIGLKPGSVELRTLPVYRTDDAILADAQAVVDSLLVEPRARRQVKLRVDDGQVTLAGEVDTVDQARLAERGVLSVAGVRGLVLDLVAQETLASLVEERIAALGSSVMNGHGPIQVYSEHGIVYLEGSVPTAKARQAAEQAALAAAGTKVVVNNLTINGEPPERAQGTGPLVRNR